MKVIKQVQAPASVPYDYIIANKVYDVVEQGPMSMTIIDDDNELMTILHDSCNHLGGGNWIIL